MHVVIHLTTTFELIRIEPSPFLSSISKIGTRQLFSKNPNNNAWTKKKRECFPGAGNGASTFLPLVLSQRKLLWMTW